MGVWNTTYSALRVNLIQELCDLDTIYLVTPNTLTTGQ